MSLVNNFVDAYIFYPRRVDLEHAFGKWMLFVYKRHLDCVWEKLKVIVDSLVACGYVPCMRATTGRPNRYASDIDVGVIMIYTNQHENEVIQREHVLHVGQTLRSAFCDASGFAPPNQFSPHARFFYKTQEQSRQGSRMTGKLKNNTLTSLRLPDDCVFHNQTLSKWTLIDVSDTMTSRTSLRHDAQTSLTAMQLHTMGAAWDPTTNQWFAPNEKVMHRMVTATQHLKIRQEPLSIITMNVWGNVDCFLHPNAKEFLKERMQCILDQIESLQPDVLCLQETNADIITILHPHLSSQGYLAVVDATDCRSVMTYIHSVEMRLDWSEYSCDPVRVETICATQKTTSSTYLIANVHLPSGSQYTELRIAAMQQITLQLQASSHIWLLVGDTNLTFDQDIARVLPPNATDAWNAAGCPMDKRATYDYQKNSNLNSNMVGERFDRILFDPTRLTVKDFQLKTFQGPQTSKTKYKKKMADNFSGRTTVLYHSDCTWEIDYVFKELLHEVMQQTRVMYFTSDKLAAYKGEHSNERRIIVFSSSTISFGQMENLLRQFKPHVVFHFSDEFGTRAEFCDLAKLTRVFFHQHTHPNYPKHENMVQIPLGYKTGFVYQSLSNATKPSTERKLQWSFVGTLKPNRDKMLEVLQRILPNNFETHTSGGVSTQDMGSIYADSVFVPNDRGDVRLDCFRLYEAIFAGAIPVMAGNAKELKETFLFNGDDDFPPFVVSDTWAKVSRKCKRLLAAENAQELLQLQLQNREWLQKHIDEIRKQVVQARD